MANRNARRDQARIDAIIADLYQMVDRPGLRPLTSNQLKLREQSRGQMATAIKITGGQVRPEYEYGN